MPEEKKHPTVLSKDRHIVTLIFWHSHQQLGHSGRNYMLSKLRKRYWIIKGNDPGRSYLAMPIVDILELRWVSRRWQTCRKSDSFPIILHLQM